MATCLTCDGTGVVVVCCDDGESTLSSNGLGYCIHGDGEDICPDCNGEGETFDDDDDEDWWDDGE